MVPPTSSAASPTPTRQRVVADGGRSSIVAVVATSRYLAEDALADIDIELEPLAAVVDPEVAAGADAPRLHDDMPSNVLAERVFARGDAETALAEAAEARA